MTGWRKRQILEMAAMAGIPFWGSSELLENFEAFAKLVREDEREALTPRCWTQEMNDAWNKSIPDLTLAFDELMQARGQA